MTETYEDEALATLMRRASNMGEGPIAEAYRELLIAANELAPFVLNDYNPAVDFHNIQSARAWGERALTHLPRA